MKKMYSKLSIEEINSLRQKDCRLTVISFHSISVHGMRLYSCECSCGCLTLEKFIKRTTKYSVSNPKILHAYYGIMQRCYDSKNTNYDNYGGRGVTVCDEWVNSYQSFLDWSLANGWAPGLQIDKDIKGDGMLYSPETCAWVTRQVNMRNRQDAFKVVYQGKLMSIVDACETIGVKQGTIRNRIKYQGMTFEEAIAKPIIQICPR